MFWIIQSNLFKEEAVERLINAVKRRDLPHALVKVIPFGGGIEWENPEDEKRMNRAKTKIVIGSTQLSTIAQDKGWVPGAFLNRNFQVSIWSSRYNVLNGDGFVEEFGKVYLPPYEQFFIRPAFDDKPFAGGVMDRTEFFKWQKQIIELGADNGGSLKPETPVFMSSVKKIISEIRCVVVDRKIITASIYRRGGKVLYSDQVDDGVIRFAQEQIDLWVPADAFVLDVAETPNGYRVIEINCLNSAGLYACDVGKVVDALEELAIRGFTPPKPHWDHLDFIPVDS